MLLSLSRRCVRVAAFRTAPRRPLVPSAATVGGNTRLSGARSLASKAGQEEAEAEDDADDYGSLLLFESDQAFKFRALSLFGGVYTTCWFAYVAADALVLDPGGSIATNSGLVSLIGVSSVTVGGYVVRTLASRTVGRLSIETSESVAPLLRVQTYTMTGGERFDEAPLADVLPMSDPGDDSKLRTFCLPDDPQRSYLVLVDEEDAVKDAVAFSKVTCGVAPFGDDEGTASARRHHRRRRRRRR